MPSFHMQGERTTDEDMGLMSLSLGSYLGESLYISVAKLEYF